MRAFIFKPSNEFIGKVSVTSADQLPEQLKAFLVNAGPVPPHSYIEMSGKTWTITGQEPLELQEGRVAPPRSKMSEEPTREQMVQAVHEHAERLVQAGMSYAQVKKDLESCGLNGEDAVSVVDSVFLAKNQTEDLKQAGRKNMLAGALWCIGGIVVTAMTYDAAASSPTGGSYVIAWGAIIFGAAQCFRGLAQIPDKG